MRVIQRMKLSILFQALVLINIIALALLACSTNTDTICVSCDTHTDTSVIGYSSTEESQIIANKSKPSVNTKNAVDESSNFISPVVRATTITGIIMMAPSFISWLELSDNRHWYTFVYVSVLIVGSPFFLVGAALAIPGLSHFSGI